LAAFPLYNSGMLRFLIIDDHPLFREALQLTVRLAFPDAEILEAGSIDDACQAIGGGRSVDVILLDLSMPGISGFDGLLTIRSRYPKVPVVVVSGLDDPRIVQEAIGYGAAGFIPKAVNKSILAEALSEVMRGSVYVPESLKLARPVRTREKADLASRIAELTPQQLRVLQMIRQGKLNKQIAYELGVGETTVKAHVSEVLRKLDVVSRTQAVIETAKLDFEHLLSQSGPAEA
jgi:DNA-binding NarL/FixJ family response regulator